MTIKIGKHTEHLEISIEERSVVEALKTVVALVNTSGGLLMLLQPRMENLAKFFRGLQGEIKPPANTWQIAESVCPTGKSYLFVFTSTGKAHKLRGVGTFVRHEGKNRRLTVQEKNALIRKLSEKAAGQISFSELIEDSEEFKHSLGITPFRSPISMSSLQIQIAELIEQQDQPKDVFISYSHKDYSLAHKLRDELENRSLSVWIDERILQPGDVLTSDIARGIGKSKVGVVLISDASKESYWVRAEMSLMLFKA